MPSSPRLFTQRARASKPPKYFISMALPSITPKPPEGPQSPSPRTLVLSLTTATRLPRLLSSQELSWLSRMVVDTAETPGVYQTLNQLNPQMPALGRVCILPR